MFEKQNFFCYYFNFILHGVKLQFNNVHNLSSKFHNEAVFIHNFIDFCTMPEQDNGLVSRTIATNRNFVDKVRTSITITT